MPDNTLTEWLLTCVSDEGASLRDMIAYVDYRNHAILTYDELTEGLNQLRQKHPLERLGPLLHLAEQRSLPVEIPLFSQEEFARAVNEYLAKSQ